MAGVAMNDWFPIAESRPILVSDLFPNVSAIRSYGAGYEIKWLTPYRPHPTIGKDHSQKPTRWKIGGGEHRPSTAELSMIASFPSDFVFSGTPNDAWNRIGNSVPPLFMRAIARNIRSMLQTGKPFRDNRAKMNYPAILDEAWQQHLAPRADDAPTVISTFAGCGGSSLGYSMAGFRELLAVEWDNNAVETFRLNFPDVPVYHGDIGKLSTEQCLEMTGLQPGELDVFDGSPPCQGFSTAGKRRFDDDRNQLFREYVRLLRGLQPKVFVMENVSGMVKGKMKLIFAEILRELKASGYKVSARLMNAMYFNVPQSRERMIFIGVREDLEIEPSHPKAESGLVVFSTAIEHLSGNEIMPVVSDKHAYPKMIRQIRQGESIGKRFGKGFNWIRCHPQRPCPTIPKSTTYGGLGFLFLPDGSRSLSVRELARCASYPDRFVFVGGYSDGSARIGNSVPPLFMRSIARHIRTEILAA